MKISPCFLLLFFLSVSLLAQDSEMDQLRYLKEVEWPRAYREQDTELLDRILAKEFRKIGATGVWTTKQEELDYIKANKPDYESFVFHIKRLEIFENETAIIAGEGHIRNKDEKGEYLMTYQSSNILIKRKGVWKAISSHVSGIKKEYL